MPRKRKYDIASFDLTTKCTACEYAIPPERMMRIDGTQVRCPECGAEFVPVPKGNTSQLGGPFWPTS